MSEQKTVDIQDCEGNVELCIIKWFYQSCDLCPRHKKEKVVVVLG